MEDKRILELEKKIQELEKLRDQCSLTNDIKKSLISYIQSNEEFKKEILTKEEDNSKKLIATHTEYKKFSFWIIIALIIAIIAIVAIKV